MPASTVASIDAKARAVPQTNCSRNRNHTVSRASRIAPARAEAASRLRGGAADADGTNACRKGPGEGREGHDHRYPEQRDHELDARVPPERARDPAAPAPGQRVAQSEPGHEAGGDQADRPDAVAH